MADDVLRSGVACITDLMVKEGLINLDFADVRTIMAGMGKAMMGTGESSGERRAIEAAEAAISNPLLDDVCMKGASGLLVSITGGNDLTLYEVDEAASRVRAEADPDANIIVGATFDDELDGSIRVSVVATGIGLAASRAAPVIEAPRPAATQDRSRLTERLAGLAALPSGGPVDLDEPSLVLAPERGRQGRSGVARARQCDDREASGADGRNGFAAGRPEAGAAAPARPFQPAPPAAVRRPVRRMPSVDELPVVAQNAIKAKAAGDAPAIRSCGAKEKSRLSGATRQCRQIPQRYRRRDADQARAGIRPGLR